MVDAESPILVEHIVSLQCSICILDRIPKAAELSFPSLAIGVKPKKRRTSSGKIIDQIDKAETGARIRQVCPKVVQ